MVGLLDAIPAAARQAATVRETAHRPWPLPESPWFMGQSWLDLLFAHWRVDASVLRPHIPPQLEVDLFDGSAWLGITPFRLEGLRLRGVPPMPFLSDFLELNVRTYVTAGGKPGIWFFSLDASSRWAVEAARRTYHLPYFHARMSMRGLEQRSRRDGSRFEVRYSPEDEPAPARDGTLEHFLTERYCLYAVDRGLLCRAEIHHPPWPLQPAEAEIAENTMPPPGVKLPDEEPLLHYSRRQDVVIWRLEPA